MPNEYTRTMSLLCNREQLEWAEHKMLQRIVHAACDGTSRDNGVCQCEAHVLQVS